MRLRLKQLAGIVIAVVAAAPGLPVAACGLEGGPGDSFGAAHPDSLGVAFAARDAIDKGMLARDSALEATLAHDRADDRLRKLAAELPAPKAAASVAVLLVEAGTWTRLEPKAGTWAVTSHADGPQRHDTTLVASELALRDLVGGRLSGIESLARGLVVVSGDRRNREALVSALRQAYPGKASTIALR